MKALDPYRWLIGAALVAAIVFGLAWYRGSLIEQGRAECEEAHRVAAEQAAEVQKGQNEQATKEVIVTETVIETQYRDRIKEVIRYVPKPGTTCPADPEFVRLFNGTD